MIRIVIIGGDALYYRILDKIRDYEAKGLIKVIGVIKELCENIYFPWNKISLEQLAVDCNIDYMLLASEKTELIEQAWEKLLSIGWDRSKILYGFIWDNEDFSLEKKKESLTDEIIGNQIIDLHRTYYKRNRFGKTISLEIGRMSYIAGINVIGAYNDSKAEISVGNYSSISFNVTFQSCINGTHDYRNVATMPDGVRYRVGEFIIGNDVWIGQETVFKTKSDNKISIGDGAVVAANSVVVSDVPPFSIVGGNPAKIIKYRFSEQIINEIKKIRWWTWPAQVVAERRGDFRDPERFVEIYKQKT